MAAQSLPSATKVPVDIWWIFWLINCISPMRYNIFCINASGGEYFFLYTIVLGLSCLTSFIIKLLSWKWRCLEQVLNGWCIRWPLCLAPNKTETQPFKSATTKCFQPQGQQCHYFYFDFWTLWFPHITWILRQRHIHQKSMPLFENIILHEVKR